LYWLVGDFSASFEVQAGTWRLMREEFVVDAGEEGKTGYHIAS
jgi:hypothetical protein